MTNIHRIILLNLLFVKMNFLFLKTYNKLESSTCDAINETPRVDALSVIPDLKSMIMRCMLFHITVVIFFV